MLWIQDSSNNCISSKDDVMHFFSFLKNKYFWANLLVFAVLGFLLSLGVLFSLKIITKWGKSSVIPKVVNLSLENAIKKIEDAGLDYEVKDTVFRLDLKDGTVLEIQPPAGLEIKTGRSVYLVISSKKPPMVEMPNLVGRSSLRFATIELESRGLKVGSLSYIPSSEKDAVLHQKIGNTEIKPGTIIPKGTSINLTLGDGLTGIAISPPFLIGKKMAEVQSILAAMGLTGNFYFDKNLEDSSAGIVYNQYPSAVLDEKINLGEPIDIFFGKSIPQNILKDSALKARLDQENAQ
jgi:eukaryotic-like serine/threonine-protein kinase